MSASLLEHLPLLNVSLRNLPLWGCSSGASCATSCVFAAFSSTWYYFKGSAFFEGIFYYLESLCGFFFYFRSLLKRIFLMKICLRASSLSHEKFLVVRISLRDSSSILDTFKSFYSYI